VPLKTKQNHNTHSCRQTDDQQVSYMWSDSSSELHSLTIQPHLTYVTSPSWYL